MKKKSVMARGGMKTKMRGGMKTKMRGGMETKMMGGMGTKMKLFYIQLMITKVKR